MNKTKWTTKDVTDYINKLSRKDKIDLIVEVFMVNLRKHNWKFCDHFMEKLRDITNQ